MKRNLSVILAACCALAFSDGVAKATTFTVWDFSAACFGAVSVACADNFNGFGLALSNTSNTPASNVVQAVAAGTPGQGFGAGVSAAAKQIGTSTVDTVSGNSAGGVLNAVQAGTPGQGLANGVSAALGGIYPNVQGYSTISGLSGPTGNSQADALIGTMSNATMAFVNAPSGAWYDPPISYSYEYQMTGSSLFTVIGFPTGYADPFTVSTEGFTGTFLGGTSLNFVSLLGSGVADFIISGIVLLPNSPPDFSLQLAFNTSTADFTVTAIGADTPLPAALPLFATGLGGLGLLGWRRKRKMRTS